MDLSVSGLYDLLIKDTDAELLPETGKMSTELLSNADADASFVDYFSKQLKRTLAEMPDQSVAAKQKIIEKLVLELPRNTKEQPKLIDPATRLLAIHPEQPKAPLRPETGVVEPWLFTQENGGPALKDELIKELSSSDRVDILVSFITMSGVRKLQEIFNQITTLNSDGKARTKIRVLTTTYMGNTEQAALNQLANLPGCEVRVSLDGQRTRLHAKAWIFHRNSGFSTAYVGSANLSRSALIAGIEWTTKFTQHTQNNLISLAKANFETLWHDKEFQLYDPNVEGHRKQLRAALRQESGGNNSLGLQTFFDIQPKPYQEDMLQKLASERLEGRKRNLLVAATGTGKTVVAALDYRRQCEIKGGQPRLLFVAHQQRILEQALYTYRQVLRDPNFGELLGGGNDPASHDHLFTTIQSAVSRDIAVERGSKHWNVVVIDECHRMASNSFQTLLSNLSPEILLGLTATPERTDGQPIIQHFDASANGGPAVELRLWHALDMELVAPFEYYGCDDTTDFSRINWRGNQSEINKAVATLVDQNEERAKAVLDAWARLTGNVGSCRAIAFCVSVAHAEFMASFFNQNGVNAAAVTGIAKTTERQQSISRLKSGELNVLCTVDLFNEGVDIPEIDTLLLLRPTQSSVLFQQQIGRGLRRNIGKESCLVLDFVGQYSADFRFDILLSSITGQNKRELVENAERGFSRLPTGCHIHLEKKTRALVLANLKQAANTNWKRLTNELQNYYSLKSNKTTLPGFINDCGVELTDVYRSKVNKTGWTVLQRDAGHITSDPSPSEDWLSRRMHSLIHHTDPKHIGFLRKIGQSGGHLDEPTAIEIARLQMIQYQFNTSQNKASHWSEWLENVQNSPEIARELVELSAELNSKSAVKPQPVEGLEYAPLNLHCPYTKNEIMTAVGYFSDEKRQSHKEGRAALEERKTELFFVTLDKTEGFHPSIEYQDYALNVDKFHWQSQSGTGPETTIGRRYIESVHNDWSFQIFVRSKPKAPFYALGPVTLIDWEGSKPMSINWQLKTAMPLSLYRQFCTIRDQ